MNVFAQTRNFRSQTTNTTHDKIDFDAGTGGFVKFLDDFRINHGVELSDDPGRFSRARMIALSFDQLNQSGAQIKRRDHHFLQAGITSKTGQRIEDDRDFVR